MFIIVLPYELHCLKCEFNNSVASNQTLNNAHTSTLRVTDRASTPGMKYQERKHGNTCSSEEGAALPLHSAGSSVVTTQTMNSLAAVVSEVVILHRGKREGA